MIEYESLYRANQPFMLDFEKRFRDLLQGGWYILGKNVEKFESDFKSFHKLNHFYGLASGLDALVIALDLCHLPPGSEVIVPANTYIASIFAILRAGHRPVLVEPDIQTYNIDHNLIEQAITPKTRAIMIVHLYGRPCEMDPIMQIAKKHKLLLIEDCAQAHGAKYKNQLIGTFGDFAAFSFYPTKNLGALGDAGGLGFKNDQHLEEIRKLRNYGSSVKYVFDIVGYNSRLDEIQAAFLSIKLRRLEEINEKKRNLATIYLNEIKGDFILPINYDHHQHVFHIFNIRHEKRDQLRDHLLKNEIKTEVHYPISPNRQKALADLNLSDFPISEEIHRTTLSLPISWFHTEKDVEAVVTALNSF